jgi:hypothetical protein
MQITVPASCQTLLLHGFAVNSLGLVTQASFTASATCPANLQGCTNLTAVGVAMELTLEVEVRETDAGQVLRRGFGILPTTGFSPTNVDPNVVLLRVTLPVQPSFVSRQVRRGTTLSQLASSIIGLSGLLGLFGTVLSKIEVLVMPRLRSFKLTKRPSSGTLDKDAASPRGSAALPGKPGATASKVKLHLGDGEATAGTVNPMHATRASLRAMLPLSLVPLTDGSSGTAAGGVGMFDVGAQDDVDVARTGARPVQAGRMTSV